MRKLTSELYSLLSLALLVIWSVQYLEDHYENTGEAIAKHQTAPDQLDTNILSLLSSAPPELKSSADRSCYGDPRIHVKSCTRISSLFGKEQL